MKRVMLGLLLLPGTCFGQDVFSIELEGTIVSVNDGYPAVWCVGDPTRRVMEPGDGVKMRSTVVMSGGDRDGWGEIEIVGKRRESGLNAYYDVERPESLMLGTDPEDRHPNTVLDAWAEPSGLVVNILHDGGPHPIPDAHADDGMCIAKGTVTSVNFLVTGDSTRDGLFNSSDLVAVFQLGEYEDALPLNSTWDTGDWDADAEFGSGDLVVAFQAGKYEQPGEAVVPEPSSLLLALLGFCYPVRWLRR